MVKQIKNSEKQLLTTIPELDDQLNQQQVAALFSKSVQTIIHWKRQGKIPFFQIGVNPIFSRKQLSIVAAKNQHLLK